jgi:hypothetical protein
MEFLAQLTELVMVAPGAFTRWCFVRSRSYADVLNEDNPYNYVLSWFVIILVAVSVACLM